MDELVTSLLDCGLYSACSGLHGEVQKTGCGRIQTELMSVCDNIFKEISSKCCGGIKKFRSVVNYVGINCSC